MGHLGAEVAVGGGPEPQVFGPQAGAEAVRVAPLQPLGQGRAHGAFHQEAAALQLQLGAADGGDGQQVHGRAADELGHEGVGGPAIELQGRAELLQLAPVEHRNPVAHGHGLHLVVGHVDRCGAEPALQLDDLAAGAAAQLGIEVAEGLIHQEHGRLAGDRPAQGHPLLLAAGEFLRQAIEQGPQFQGLGHLLDHGFDPVFAPGAKPQRAWQAAAGPVQAIGQFLQGAALALAPQAEADVVGHAQVRVEGVALEHHRHIPLGGPQLGDPAIAHEQVAAAGAFQAGE